MKTLKSFMLLVGILLGSTVFYSCLDDDDAYSEFWRDSVQAIVTVKPLSDNSYYMQLDDSTTLFPTNSYVPENLKEIRAFVVYKNDEKKTEGYDQSVQLLRMDTLLTKPIGAASSSLLYVEKEMPRPAAVSNSPASSFFKSMLATPDTPCMSR